MSKKILVVGSGAWGCSIANLIAQNNHQTNIYSNDLETLKEIKNLKTNYKFLPKIQLSKNLVVDENVDRAIKGVDYLFIVIPAKFLKDFIEQISNLLADKTKIIVATKGLIDAEPFLISKLFSGFVMNILNFLLAEYSHSTISFIRINLTFCTKNKI